MFALLFLIAMIASFLPAHQAKAYGETFEWTSKDTARMFGGDFDKHNLDGSNDDPLTFTMSGSGEDAYLVADRALSMRESSIFGDDECTLWLKIVPQTDPLLWPSVEIPDPSFPEDSGETTTISSRGWELYQDIDRDEDPGGHGICGGFDGLDWDTSTLRGRAVLNEYQRENFADFASDAKLIIKIHCPDVPENKIDNLRQDDAERIKKEIAENEDYSCKELEERVDEELEKDIITGVNETSVNCITTQGATGFLICPVITMASNAVDELYGFIIGTMHFSLIEPGQRTDGDSTPRLEGGAAALDENQYNTAYQSWQAVSRIATILLVIAFLVMVIGQAVSNIFDAYSIKKILPRIIVAIIAINLSWFLVTFALEVGNVIGAGARDIILSPFSDENGVVDLLISAPTSGSRIFDLLVISTGTGISALFLIKAFSWIAWLLLAILLPIFVGILLTIAVLILRQGFLVALLIFAPLAIALWVLPGTKSAYDKWQGILMGLILFYPIFQIVIAVCAMLAIVIGGLGEPPSDQ